MASTLIKDAVKMVASSNGWQIVSQTDDKGGLHLKKVYREKKKQFLPTQKRWKKRITDHEVHLKVEINDRSFEIKSMQDNEKFLAQNSNKKKLNNDLVKLEKSIYGELISKTL
jgi:hypothetical protein